MAQMAGIAPCRGTALETLLVRRHPATLLQPEQERLLDDVVVGLTRMPTVGGDEVAQDDGDFDEGVVLVHHGKPRQTMASHGLGLAGGGR